MVNLDISDGEDDWYGGVQGAAYQRNSTGKREDPGSS